MGMQHSTTKHLPVLNQKLMKKLAQRKLVGMTVLGEKVILVYKRSRPNAKCIPSLSQIFMEKLAHKNLPFLSQKLMKKLAQRNLVGVTISSEKVILVSKCPRPAKKRSPFLRQNFMEKLAHRNLPFLSQKLMKKLAQRKLVGMTVLDYRKRAE